MATVPEQIEHERPAAQGHGGPRGQRRPPTGEERRQARRERRDDRARERKKRRELAAATIWLPALGVEMSTRGSFRGAAPSQDDCSVRWPGRTPGRQAPG